MLAQGPVVVAVRLEHPAVALEMADQLALGALEAVVVDTRKEDMVGNIHMEVVVDNILVGPDQPAGLQVPHQY